MTESFFKRMFLVGALWNLLGGAFIVLATNWIFSSAGLAPPVPPLYYQAWIALFLTFGIGYWIVSRDPYPNRNIALLGMIGKLAFAGVFVYNLLAFEGQVPRFFLIPAAGDLIFAFLFWLYLRQARPSA
jgi:small multidrug resistance pump